MMSSLPNSRTAVCVTLSGKSGAVTLPTQAVATPPDALIELTTPSAVSPSRSLTTTCAPCWANNVATARPMPRPEPVTIADLPSSNFIFLRAGYSSHKRFVLGGEECAAPFSSKTVVAYWADGCSPVDKGEIGPSHWRRAGSQVYHGRIQSRLQHPFRTRLSARFTSQIRH